jgi:uncharacterized protein (DUF4415 family)
MRKSYDFSDSKKNPYACRLKQQVTIRLDQDTIQCFRRVGEETGIGYQTLINLYLRQCASAGKKLSNIWASPNRGAASKGARRTAK